MALDNQHVVRGNVLAEGIVAPTSTSWPPDAWDNQLLWKLLEQQLYIYSVATDSWWPVGTATTAEPVTNDVARTLGDTFAVVRANWFGGASPLVVNHSMGTWDNLWKYCYWQFAVQATNNWTATVKFDTQNDLFTYMETHLPTTAGTYDSNTQYRCYELVDVAQAWPTKIRHRNSLAASMMGGKRWVKKSTPGSPAYYGIDVKFNAYYVAWANSVGMRCLNNLLTAAPYSDAPIVTNDDDVIWYHRGSRGTLLRFPKIGKQVSNSGVPGQHGKAWDRTTASYIAAPMGGYEIHEPFFCYDADRAGTLALSPLPINILVDHREHELHSPMVAVFPLSLGGTPGNERYWSFMVVPHGMDTFFTDYVDTAVGYEVVLCLRQRNTFHKFYTLATEHGSNFETSMWIHPTLFSEKDGSRVGTSIDKDTIPASVDVALRNKTTGRRTAWFPLYKVARHTRHAALRVLPATYKP